MSLSVDPWEGKPPKGFEHDKYSRLKVDPDEFETVREALQLIDDEGLNCYRAARAMDLPRSTLRGIDQIPRKRRWYTEYEATMDERIQHALDEYQTEDRGSQ